MLKDKQAPTRAGKIHLQLVASSDRPAAAIDRARRDPRSPSAAPVQASAAAAQPKPDVYRPKRSLVATLADDIAFGAASVYSVSDFATFPLHMAVDTGSAAGEAQRAAAAAWRSSPPEPAGWFAQLKERATRMVADWRHEREVARALEHLSSLDGYLLRDIGMERSNLDRLLRKSRPRD
ncbi:DUF1127 domain-containing protein [Rhizobium sp. BK251]|uniref:DUF1127 domain-containing protein n=1 Tax=Rhizobium sp. BK251 TaxID=2512125 RepID=UPI00104CC659|nr:DUF1127 domain-containing protein [Rhizobium sp. BK251]TCL74836.1 uncharacterized protein DUF1127 [Rhizobium sp. BK251]